MAGNARTGPGGWSCTILSMAPPDITRAWRPAVPGIREVFHARYTDHAYPAHTHDTWTLFIVDDGAIRYDLDRHEHGSTGPMVTVLPPHVVHTGRPATSHGFRKRVLYLEPEVLGDDLVGASVGRPGLADPALRQRLAAVHPLLAGADDALEAESRLAFVVERLRWHLGGAPDPAGPARVSVADRLRDLLDGADAAPTLAEAGRALGVSPAHLVRTFTKRFGIAPHAYLLGRRIDRARRLLLDGQPPAGVAVAVGFYDQAHFTRHFRRYLGTTPARYARAGRMAEGLTDKAIASPDRSR